MTGKRNQQTGSTFAEIDASTNQTIASQGDEVPEGVTRELAPGTRSGRYIVLEQLGRGGMGVVYKAYDPDLDRKIALKLLSTRRGSESRGDRARERLLREAKALAQLSHPNVVSAYDVGTLDDDVFVAMELVEGTTLPQWLRDERPSWRQIIGVMIDAGKGIAAAHQAGLIHRDIKPDNIVIGKDGRPRVLDFGLARAASFDESSQDPVDDEAAQELEDEHALESGHSLRTPMTLAGAVLGTPGYMAPEQYRAGELDEKTDQYSFCVTLYEALFDRRPHVGSTYKQVKQRVLSEPAATPPAEPRLPARLRRVLMRGLSAAKEDRFAGMAELLAALAWDPRTRRRRLVGLATLLLLLGASFTAAAIWQSRLHRLCQGSERALAGVWDQPRQQAIEKAFLATGLNYAADTNRRVAEQLDSYAQAWVTMRVEACEATHLRGEQSQNLLDLRMRCLDRRIGEMGALTQLFATAADSKVVDKAIVAAHGLARLQSCADVEALTATVAPPSQPAVRKKVAALRKRLNQAVAQNRAGKYKMALETVQTIAREQKSITYLPLQAELSFLQGSLLAKTGDANSARLRLKEAIRAAAGARDDRLRARATAELVYVLGHYLARYAEAMEMSCLADAEVLRSGNDPVLRAQVLNKIGVVFVPQQKYQTAAKYLNEALALAEKSLDRDDLQIASIRNNLAYALSEEGKHRQAGDQYRAAIAIEERLLGPVHPDRGFAFMNLAGSLYSLGDMEAALKNYRRALKIWEDSHGPRHPDVAMVLGNLGVVLSQNGDYAEARRVLERSLIIWTQTMGEDHPKVAYSLNGLGDLLKKQGQCPQARPYFERTLAIWEKSLGDQHPLLAYPLLSLGQCSLTAALPAQALGPLTRALALLEAKPDNPQLLAQTRFDLAQALWDTKQNRTRAITLARSAHQSLSATDDPDPSLLAKINSWLASHPGL